MSGWSEAKVLAHLRSIYDIGDGTTGSEWSMLTQVPVLGRRIDALLMHRDSGQRVAIEVKVSKADYRRDTDEKRRPAEVLAHVCYYVTPPFLLREVGLPLRWGLIEVGHPALDEHIHSLPATHNLHPATEPLLAAVFDRASDDAEAIRRAENPTTDTVALLRRVESLSGQVERARLAQRREHDRLLVAQSAMLAVEGMQECADCHQSIEWSPTTRGGPVWEHVDVRAGATCHRMRAEAARQEQERRTGARYLSGLAAPVVPKALSARR